MQSPGGEREERFVRLGPEGGAEPLFFVYPGLDAPFGHELVEACGRPFLLLSRREAPALEPPPGFAEMARRHVETIRELQAKGPYRVGGFGAGAALAAEIAWQLEAAGEAVPELLLVADPLLSRRWWRAARRAAGLVTRDRVERLELFNFAGRLGQVGLDLFKRGGVARVRESLARARHRVQRQGSLRAFGPNSRSSDDTLKALLWAWAGHAGRRPSAPVARLEVRRNENGMMELDLNAPAPLSSPCSTSPDASSSALLAIPSRSISAT